MNLAGMLLLFIGVGVGFILVHLLLGKIIRPSKPGAEKATIYECGEPTIGSAWVQFDLRFYVVALLFVIFDVEVAFFFPWAEVFGKANAVAAIDASSNPAQWPDSKLKDYGEKVSALIPPTAGDPANDEILKDYRDPKALRERLEKNPREVEINASVARTFAVLALGEIVVFFGVLLVGFAYLWNRGDLEWVRSLAERSGRTPVGPAAPPAPATVKPSALASAPVTAGSH